MHAFVLTLLLAASPSVQAPSPFTSVATVEGISESRLPNGLRLVLVPDPSVATVTVNMTVLVGSRHEGYGEGGMAHLLEHMLFKGTPKTPKVDAAMSARGADANATTAEDRTNYFETLPASADNLQWAIRFEADRLMNTVFRAKDLETEMPVVRNEFEASENSANGVLRGRVRNAAYLWHNYGHEVIGNRSDIENVPIENLQAFYKKHYRPENVVLFVSGRFDAQDVFRWVRDSFGKIPKAGRLVPRAPTREPAQEGERFVTLTRHGGTQAVHSVWHIPAATDADYPALMVLQGVLGDAPQGRVYQALVETKRAAGAQCELDQLAEPGLFSCSVALGPKDALDDARTGLLAAVEGLSKMPVTEAEVERSRTAWLSQLEQILSSSPAAVSWLSEWAAAGDWRMSFVQRDALRKVTSAEVMRVANRYLSQQNRTLGEYRPTEKPVKVEVAAPRDVAELVKGYVGGKGVALGEAFDTSCSNIEARTVRSKLPNGAQVALLSKKTRGATVNLAMSLRFGTQQTLEGRHQLQQVVAAMVNRGTKKLGFKELRSELEKLKAVLAVHAANQGAEVRLSVQRPELRAALELMAEVLETPGFEAREFEAVRRQFLARLEEAKTSPDSVGHLELERALAPLPKDHPKYEATIDERILELQSMTLEHVRAFHSRFYGAQSAQIAVVGDFDAPALQTELARHFGAWTSKERYAVADDSYVETRPLKKDLQVPGRENAWIGGATTLSLTTASPEFPAMLLAAHLLGGGVSSRLFQEVREKQGLSYGAMAGLEVPSRTKRGALMLVAIFAPTNKERIAQALENELRRWPVMSREELDLSRKDLLHGRAQARSDDGAVAQMLTEHLLLGRDMSWEARLDDALSRVTVEEVSAAVKKFVDPARFVWIRAGTLNSAKSDGPPASTQ
jgi:zinc protease